MSDFDDLFSLAVNAFDMMGDWTPLGWTSTSRTTPRFQDTFDPRPENCSSGVSPLRTVSIRPFLRQPVCLRAYCQDEHMFVRYTDGRLIRFPISCNHRFEGRTAEELDRIEIRPLGLFWPELKVNLSHVDLREGRFGQA